MRTMTTTVYTAAELKAGSEGGGSDAFLLGKAFERALERYRKNVYEDPAWASEHRASLKAVRAALGSRLPNSVFGRVEAHEFHDVRRCMAWVENNILAPLRQPWLPLSHPKRRATSSYGGDYRPGHVKPCPFTGYHLDDGLLEYVTSGARDGVSPRDLLRGLEAEADRHWEADLEDQASERAFIDAAEANGWEFDGLGRMV